MTPYERAPNLVRAQKKRSVSLPQGKVCLKVRRLASLLGHTDLGLGEAAIMNANYIAICEVGCVM